MKFDEQMFDGDSRSQQIVHRGVFGAFDVHLENVDPVVAQFGEQCRYSFDWQFARSSCPFFCDGRVRNIRRVFWRRKPRDAVMTSDPARVEMEIRGKLLASNPRDRARRGIERVNRCIEGANHFDIEGNIFPHTKRVDEWMLRKSRWTNGPRCPLVSQINHFLVKLFWEIDIPASKDSRRPLYTLDLGLYEVHCLRSRTIVQRFTDFFLEASLTERQPASSISFRSATAGLRFQGLFAQRVASLLWSDVRNR